MGPAGSMVGAVLGGVAILAVPGYDGYKAFVTVVALGMVIVALRLITTTGRGPEEVVVSVGSRRAGV